MKLSIKQNFLLILALFLVFFVMRKDDGRFVDAVSSTKMADELPIPIGAIFRYVVTFWNNIQKDR